MQKIVINNELNVQISKDNPINLDFSAGRWDGAFQSPNLNFTNIYFAEFKSADSEINPVDYISKHWKTNHAYKNIPCKIVDSGIVVLDGYIDMFNKDNYINQVDGHYTDVMRLAVTETRKTLEQQLNSLKIASLWLAIVDKGYRNEIITILNPSPGRVETATLAISIAMVTIQAVQAVQDLAKNISKAATAGLFLTSAGGAGTWVAIDLVASSIVLATSIIALTIMIKDLHESIIGKKTFYNAIDAKYLLEYMFESLGFSVETDIFANDFEKMCIIARTENKGSHKQGKASNNPIPEISGLDFLLTILNIFNAKVQILGTKAVIKRKDKFFNENDAEVQLPTLKNNGIKRWNYNELYSSIKISYDSDLSDKNSVNNNKRRSLLVKYDSQIKFMNKKAINIPFSRISIKRKLNIWDQMYNSLLKILQDFGIKQDSVKNRKGAIMLQDFIFANDYIFIRDSNTASLTKDSVLDVDNLYDKFHYIDSPSNSQYFIHEEVSELPISLTDFAKLQKNNIAKDGNDNAIIIQNNIRNSQTGLHDITYRRKIPTNSVFYISPEQIKETRTYPTS